MPLLSWSYVRSGGMEIIMKKFIIIVVFVFLISILISFNYLLWDREKQLENFQDLSNSKNLSIDTLGEKINTLDKQNKDLTEKLASLTDENSRIKNTNYMLTSENQQIKQELSDKREIILMLKKNLNVEPFLAIVKKWSDAVNSKNFKTAQTYISILSNDEILSSPNIFKSNYQNEIKSIDLKAFKIYTDMTDAEHLAKIQFEAVFQVDKPESPNEGMEEVTNVLYKQGENIKYVTMQFDAAAGEWRITQLSDKP